MEIYNREFNGLFDSPKPGLFVFCERVKDEAMRWESRHQDALMGRYTHRQKRKDLSWPEIQQDFDGWAPKKEETFKERVIFVFGLYEGNICGIFDVSSWFFIQ
jgi:hypothetical protein